MPEAEQRAQAGESANGTSRSWFFVLPHLSTLLRIFGGVLLLSGATGIAQNQDDPRKLLLQGRERVMETVRKLPRYVCTQTVDRFRYEPANPEYGSDGERRVRSCDNTIAESR